MFPQLALLRSAQDSLSSPLGFVKALTGLGPRLFAQTTLEKVLHGGLKITASYRPEAILFNKRCCTSARVRSKNGLTCMSTISTSTVTPSCFDSLRNHDETEFFLGFPEKMQRTLQTLFDEDGPPSLCPVVSLGQTDPVVSKGALSSLQFIPLWPFLKHRLQRCANLHFW